MLVKGSKIKLVAPMGVFDNVGEICKVINIAEDGTIAFSFGEGMHLGIMSSDEFEKYFVEYEENESPKRNTITEDDIEAILDGTRVTVNTAFDKCTIVSVKLPNGFVITESSSCVDPANYDEEIGVEICMNRIIDKIWELEGYRLQCELYETEHKKNNICDEECDCGCIDLDCEECCWEGSCFERD